MTILAENEAPVFGAKRSYMHMKIWKLDDDNDQSPYRSNLATTFQPDTDKSSANVDNGAFQFRSDIAFFVTVLFGHVIIRQSAKRLFVLLP